MKEDFANAILNMERLLRKRLLGSVSHIDNYRMRCKSCIESKVISVTNIKTYFTIKYSFWREDVEILTLSRRGYSKVLMRLRIQ